MYVIRISSIVHVHCRPYGVATQQLSQYHFRFPLLPDTFPRLLCDWKPHDPCWPKRQKTHPPEVSGKDILLLRKGMGAQAMIAPATLFPVEKADTILTHDLAETDMETKANTLRMEELQKVREGPPFHDIRDLMSQAEPALP